MLAFTLVVLCQIGSPQGVRLLDDAPLLAQAPSMVPMVPATEAQVSSAQLQVDIEALRKMRPSVGGGIALVASGGTAALLGGLYLGIGAGLGGFAGAVNPFFVLGAIGLGLGAPLVLIGVWLLWNRIEERGRIDEEMKNLRLQLQQSRPPPRLNAPVSPPPPSEILPPPQVLERGNSIQLASF
jgi:hypothetical protein